MKLTEDDIIRSEDASPLLLLEQGVSGEVTRRKYIATLRRILCVIFEDLLEGDFEERAEQFVQKGKENPDWVQDIMISLSWKLRERAELPRDDPNYLNPTSFQTYFKPLRKLLEMNNITINWKRVHMTFPERNNILDTKGWTRDEIAAMIKYARDPMERALVLVLASSGVRLGGLALKWRDLTPIYLVDGRLTVDPGEGGEVACVAINVYTGSPESYTTFITPEAYRAIQESGQMWADGTGSQPDPEHYLFLATKLLPHKASEPVIAKRVRRMATKAGLRNKRTKNGTRFPTQLVHGFRKFFNKTCKEKLSGDSLASLIRTEYMMGHQGLVSLDKNYFKTSMLEMAAEYMKVIRDLTIDDADRLKISNKILSENIQEMESKKAEELASMKEELAHMKEEMARRDKEVEELRNSRGPVGMDLVDALKGSVGTDGVPGAVVESLTEMMRQMEATHKADFEEFRKITFKELREERDAEMAKLRREFEMERRRSGG